MRFQINQTLFAVHFGFNRDDPKMYGFFGLPMLFDEIVPDDINLVKLTVTEHHKVPNSYDVDRKLDCDGYRLKDEDGNVFTNQYPTATYGQLSVDADNRFYNRGDEGKSLTQRREENPKAVFECQLLSDVLGRMQRGIKDLKETPPDNNFYKRCIEKAELLTKLYDRVIKEFGEKYPDYRIDMAWKPLMGTTVIWPEFSIYKRVPVKQAEKMAKEDIVKDFNSDGCFEAEYSDGSRLVIMKPDAGRYLIDGVMTDVSTINVYYAEKSEDEGKEIFYVHQTEYFPHDWTEMAVDCFQMRLEDGGIKSSGLGMSLEAIAAKKKEPIEGTYQVVV